MELEALISEYLREYCGSSAEDVLPEISPKYFIDKIKSRYFPGREAQSADGNEIQFRAFCGYDKILRFISESESENGLYFLVSGGGLTSSRICFYIFPAETAADIAEMLLKRKPAPEIIISPTDTAWLIKCEKSGIVTLMNPADCKDRAIAGFFGQYGKTV